MKAFSALKFPFLQCLTQGGQTALAKEALYIGKRTDPWSLDRHLRTILLLESVLNSLYIPDSAWILAFRSVLEQLSRHSNLEEILD